jgi:hypothetical protein
MSTIGVANQVDSSNLTFILEVYMFKALALNEKPYAGIDSVLM